MSKLGRATSLKTTPPSHQAADTCGLVAATPIYKYWRISPDLLSQSRPHAIKLDSFNIASIGFTKHETNNVFLLMNS
jgi:hypothetical protein